MSKISVKRFDTKLNATRIIYTFDQSVNSALDPFRDHESKPCFGSREFQLVVVTNELVNFLALESWCQRISLNGCFMVKFA